MVKHIALVVLLVGCNVSLFSSSEHGVCGTDGPIDTMTIVADAPPDAAPTQFGILINGQSNAQGRKPCTAVTLSTHACDVRTWAREWDQESDSPIDPFSWQVDRNDVSLSPRGGNNFGVELSLADELHANALVFAIAKSAVGSSDKAAHWFNHCYASVTGAPDVGCTYHNPTTGLAQPYPSTGASIRQRTLDQGDKLEAAGFPVRVVIEIQGETDASYSLYSQLYPSPIGGFVSHFDENESDWIEQVHLHYPDALIFLNELDSAMIFNRTSDLRTAQEHVAATHPYVRLVSQEGVPIDSAHFQADALWTIGQRDADAILGAL